MNNDNLSGFVLCVDSLILHEKDCHNGLAICLSVYQLKLGRLSLFLG